MFYQLKILILLKKKKNCIPLIYLNGAFIYLRRACISTSAEKHPAREKLHYSVKNFCLGIQVKC